MNQVDRLQSSARSQAVLASLAQELAAVPRSLEDMLRALHHAYDLGQCDARLGVRLPSTEVANG